MKKSLAMVNELIDIIEADNAYFAMARQVAIMSIRGPVSDELKQQQLDEFETAMRLRREFTERWDTDLSKTDGRR